MKKSDLTRRAFLAATTSATLSAAAAKAAPNSAEVVPGKKSPNEKLNVAGIGVGGKGEGDIASCKRENVVALADADWKRAEASFYRFEDAKRYKDYRKMLEEMPEIDAVTISTPDHTHAPAAHMAMKMGKHVYVQKPLTHTIAEARMLTNLAKETGVITQMGNQGHCQDGVRELCEMMWDGAIGEVREAHIWTNRPIWPQGLMRPEGSDPVRDQLDWDLWLGVAPQRPYVNKHPETGNDCYCPFVWRGWWDFGCGAIGDMACHIMDPAFWSLKLIEADNFTVEVIKQEGMTSENPPNKSIVKFQFPARGEMPAVDVYWYDGGLLPDRPADIPADVELGEGDNGSLFVGSEGYLTTGTYGGDSRIVPPEKAKDYKKPEETIPRVPGQDPYRDWLKAIKEGHKATSDFSYAGPLTEVANMGNVALLADDGKLEWDSKAFRFTNSEKANQMLTKEYRKGWDWLVEDLPV